MSVSRNIRDIFSAMINDRKIIFLILATIMITISYISTSIVYFSFQSLSRVFVSYIPFAFAWLIMAWAITDRSVLRTPYPYIFVFLVLFIHKIYWSLFYWLFPPVYRGGSESSDALALGGGNLAIPSQEWLDLKMNATYLYMVIEIIVILSIFLLFWYLTHPHDFSKRKYRQLNLKNKRLIFVILGVFFTSMPLWLWHVLEAIWGTGIYEFFINFDYIIWFSFMFHGIPIAIGYVLLANVITKIKTQIKYGLYLLVFIFSILPFIPFHSMLDISWDRVIIGSYFSVIYFVSYFFIFLSFILLSKTKYIEQ